VMFFSTLVFGVFVRLVLVLGGMLGCKLECVVFYFFLLARKNLTL
jgi:hypothetical protein